MHHDLLHTRVVGGHGGVVVGGLHEDKSLAKVELTYSKTIAGSEVQGSLQSIGVSRGTFQDQSGARTQEDMNIFPEFECLLKSMDWAKLISTPGLSLGHGSSRQHVQDVVQQHGQGEPLQSAAGNAHTVHTRDLGNAVLIPEHNCKVRIPKQAVFYLTVGTVKTVIPTSGHL